MAALHFLFHHELGHIAYGHTDLLSSQMGHTPQLLREATTAPSSAVISPDLYQSMEVDADLHAATSLVAAVVTNETLCGVKMTHFLESRTDILLVGSIAMLQMFHLFYGGAVDVHTYRLQTHPLPEIRLLKFWIRLEQVRANLSGRSLDTTTAPPIEGKTIESLPQSMRDSLFPVLRLQGRIDITEEARRVRSNEDRYEKQLSAFAMIPVGGVIF